MAASQTVSNPASGTPGSGSTRPRNDTRLGRVAAGTFANLIGQILNLGGQLVLVPVFLTRWGNQQYGEWLALSAAVAVLTTLDLGMQTYVVNRLNQAHELNRFEEYSRILNTGLSLHLLLGTAGLVAILPALFLGPIDVWLKLQATPRSTAALVAALLSIQAVYSIAYGTVAGVYRTVREYARGQMVNNVRVAANLAVTIGVIRSGGGFVAVALSQLLVLAASSAFVCYDVSRRHQQVRFDLRRADLKLGISFVLPSLMFLGLQLVSALSVQGSTLLISATLGAAAVVPFVTLRTLSNMIVQGAGTVHLAVWPEFTAMEANANWDGLRRIHLLTAKIVMWVAMVSGVFLINDGERLVAVWTRGRVPYDAGLMLAFLLFVVSQAHEHASSILMSSCNRQKMVFWCSTIATLAGFGLGWLMTPRWGVAGFVFGIAISNLLICAIPLPWLACRYIRDSMLRFTREVSARSTAVFILIYAAARILAPLSMRHPNVLQQLVWDGLIVSILGLCGGYFVLLSSSERERLDGIAANLYSRIRS